MARLGVTYMEVAEAANELVGQGKNPTIEQIRLFIGSGSSTTIANHLREWRRSRLSDETTATKERVPEELVTILRGLWGKVVDQSDITIADLEARHQAAIEALQQELTKYQKNNRRWQKLYHQWGQDNMRLAEENKVLQATSQAMRDEMMQLKYENIRLIQAREHYQAQYQAQVVETQSERDHFRQLIENEQLRNEQLHALIQMLQATIASQDVKLRQLTDDYTQLQTQYNKLDAAYTLSQEEKLKLAGRVEQLEQLYHQVKSWELALED